MTARINPVSSGFTVSVSCPDAVRANVKWSTPAIASHVLPQNNSYTADVWRHSLEVLPSIERMSAGLSLVVTLTCSTAAPKEKPYLEIAPTILWIWTSASNDVYSNTQWNVD